MPSIEIYTRGWCPYCHMAKGLLESKGQEFIEFVTSEQPRAPAYFSYDATLNRKERVTLEENLVDRGETHAVAATNVFARTDGRWRLVAHHGSPVMVP